MLINHDFDWEADLEESLDPGPDPASSRARGHIRPGEQVTIVERHRGLSRSTLVLAMVALALSVASAIPKDPLQNAAVPIKHQQTEAVRSSPPQSVRPGDQAQD
jgi:hypothetical protein